MIGTVHQIFIGCTLASLLTFASAEGAVINLPTTEFWTVDRLVPDDDPVGVADIRTISGSPIVSITDLSVSIQLSGGFVGDVFATLSHGTGFSVLLNRIGRTSSNSLGSAASNLDVILRDNAPSDVHFAIPLNDLVSGPFQPDARVESPLLVTDASDRTAFLDSFDGLGANGEWTLFVADFSGADQVTLDGWGLSIDGVIPEPSLPALLVGAAIPILYRRIRGR